MNRKTKISLLMVGYAGTFAIPGCAMDAPDDGTEQTSAAEAEVTQGPGGVGTNTIGQFHVIKLSNTSLCMQPVGGSTGNVNVELATCAFSAPAQNWLFVAKAGRWEVVNAQSGKCLYGPGVASSGNGPITHEDCDVSTSPGTPASNALWKPSSLTNFSSIQSFVGHRDTGFCVRAWDIEVGGQLDLARCDGSPTVTWSVGIQ